MKQLTRDLYTSGRVWLSLSHSFTQPTANNGSELELAKINGDFVTLNAGALFILSLWSAGSKTPEKFFIPEYKIHELKQILENMYDCKNDDKYVRDGELTVEGSSDVLYYRLTLNNKKYIDIHLVEVDNYGTKVVNIAISLEGKLYTMFDTNVYDLIDIIPSPSEITRYKQDAAQLYLIKSLLGDGVKSAAPSNTSSKETSEKIVPKSEPKTINRIDRGSVTKSRETSAPIILERETTKKEVVKQTAPVIEEPVIDITEISDEDILSVPESSGGVDYASLLADSDEE